MNVILLTPSLLYVLIYRCRASGKSLKDLRESETGLSSCTAYPDRQYNFRFFSESSFPDILLVQISLFIPVEKFYPQIETECLENLQILKELLSAWERLIKGLGTIFHTSINLGHLDSTPDKGTTVSVENSGDF